MTYSIDSSFCVVIFFEIFYTVCLLPLILSNFMKDKSVAEHSSYISSLDY